MQKNKINSVVEAYKSMYDEDVLSENILSKLPGAHGRYMKKLKVAHDHHMNMLKGHNSLEDKIDPSRGADDDANTDPERQVAHGHATIAHDGAAQSIYKLAQHAKKNKLGGHPTDDVGKKLHNQAKSDSKHAHSMSHAAIKDDNANSDSHMDHVKKLNMLFKHVQPHTHIATTSHGHMDEAYNVNEGEGLDTLQTRAHKSAARDKDQAHNHREAAKHDEVAKIHAKARSGFRTSWTHQNHDFASMHDEAEKQHKNAASTLRKGHAGARMHSKSAHDETEHVLNHYHSYAHPRHEEDPRSSTPSANARHEYNKIKPGKVVPQGSL